MIVILPQTFPKLSHTSEVKYEKYLIKHSRRRRRHHHHHYHHQHNNYFQHLWIKYELISDKDT